jgi:hypothetical protein
LINLCSVIFALVYVYVIYSFIVYTNHLLPDKIFNDKDLVVGNFP